MNKEQAKQIKRFVDVREWLKECVIKDDDAHTIHQTAFEKWLQKEGLDSNCARVDISKLFEKMKEADLLEAE